MTTITLNRRDNANPHLSYGFISNGMQCYSGFGLKNEAVVKKMSSLLPLGVQHDFLEGKTIEVENSVFDSIRSLWHSMRYKKYKSVYVDRDANMAHVAQIYAAYKSRELIMVQYEEGYEMYPSDDEDACVSDDGLNHVLYVGKSTGVKPVLLHMESSCARGGGEFMFKGITSIKRIGGALCA
jgi:hypothetical protein